MKKSLFNNYFKSLYVVFSLSVFFGRIFRTDAAKIDWNQSNGIIRVMACSRDAITYLKYRS